MIPAHELIALPGRAWRHLRAYGVRATTRRLWSVGREGIWGSEPAPDELPPGVVPRDPRAIRAALDSPGRGHLESGEELRVVGWAWSAAGIRDVQAYLDGAPVATTSTGIARPDVARRFGRSREAARSGFDVPLPLARVDYGDHQLVVVVTDVADRRRALGRAFGYVSTSDAYRLYHEASSPSASAVRRLSAETSRDTHEVVVWVDATVDDNLLATIRSLAEQQHPQMRCIIVAGDEHGMRRAAAMLAAAAPAAGERFSVVVRPDAAVGAAFAAYHAFLVAGEILAPHALVAFGSTIATTRADVVYSDHDSVDDDGMHVAPWLAPDWSPDLLLAQDYVGGFFLARASRLIAARLEDWSSRRGAWRYALSLATTEDAERVAHVPFVLWSAPAMETPDTALAESERQAVVAALERRAVAARVEPAPAGTPRRVRWPLPAEHPLVSIVMPTTGNPAVLEPCVDSIVACTGYERYELVFLDNGRGQHAATIETLRKRGFTVLERDEPFNWAKLSNDGARQSTGELLLFLNDDIEAVEPDWLGELVSHAVRPDVGAVGSMLLYPDGRIQHAGVFLVNEGGGARHYFQRQDPERELYRQLHRSTREVTGNTGACLMVQRSKYEAAGGFDEQLTIAGNDVDFCLRLRTLGYRNIWTPYSRLVHHESVSRSERRVDRDEATMRRRWGRLLKGGDPYYSRHFAPGRSDCSLNMERVQRLRARSRSSLALTSP